MNTILAAPMRRSPTARSAGGTVTVTTTNAATIDATVPAVALGIGAGGSNGGAAALAFVARKFHWLDPTGTR